MSRSPESTPETPCRCIFNDVDMRAFMESSTKKELLQFVQAIGKSCTSGQAPGFDPSDPLKGLNPCMASLHGSLEQMQTWVDDFPPTQSARFGNPAFRSWHTRLMERSNAIIAAILTARESGVRSKDGVMNETLEKHRENGYNAAAGSAQFDQDPGIQHISCFLHDSFGHAARLDYGTGHESSFVVFLLVLSKVKCFGETPTLNSLKLTSLSIFDQYLQVTRRLQTIYRLEPAGSHGVWGLDDYHCLPFYFGACQLQAAGVSPDELTSPKCVLDIHLLKQHGDAWLYLSCIRYILELKQRVPFFESSPMLHDISSLTSWAQVSRGLLRLYQGEVLDKRQVVQHFVFSKYFPATWTPSQSEPKAPLTPFRPATANDPAMAPTRAPWANNLADNMAPTRGLRVGNDDPSTVTPTIAAVRNHDPSAVGPTIAPWAVDNGTDSPSGSSRVDEEHTS